MKGLIQESSSYYEHGGTQMDAYAADEVVAVPCPFCGSERREALAVEFENVGVVRCRDCSLMYTSPRLKSPEAIYWGDATTYEREAWMIRHRGAPHHRDVNYIEELTLIRRYKPRGRFLDVGCNMGFLLRKVKEMGWLPVGVEPSPSLSRLASDWWGAPVHNCFLHDLPASELGTFDVVALSDVFEHITDPRPFLGDVRRAMKDDGILYVKVPNGRFTLLKQRLLEMMGRRPRAGIWDSSEHVVHYTDQSLRRMLETGGFEVVALTFGRPVQIPAWHNYVGHYYQHASPWYLDAKRHAARAFFYYAGFLERLLRGGRIGAMPPNLVAVARKKELGQRAGGSDFDALPH